jgi:hypothetical protein
MSQEHRPGGRETAVGDDEALTVLRGIWTAQRQTAADIGPSTTKVCKNMKNIGFGGFAEGGSAEGESTAGPVDDAQRRAWRERLEREGKIVPGATSVRDLVRDAAQSSAAQTSAAQTSAAESRP